MTSSVQVSSDTSAPSTLIVGDDAGNLDGSWLSANYPPISPSTQINLARAQALGDVLTYALAGDTVPRYRNRDGFMVPALTDMAGICLPRFVSDTQAQPQGLLVEPASTNLLAYDRLGLRSGVALAGCSVSTLTRLSVDGVSQLAGLTNLTPLSEHGVALSTTSASQGAMSASFALMSPTLQYFVARYCRADGTLATAVIDTVGRTVTSLAGNVVGQVVQDRLGWTWVMLNLGRFSTTESAVFSVLAANSASGTTIYAGSADVWFVDALQVENTALPTSPIFAHASGPVTRGAETVRTPAPVTNGDNWLDTPSGASTTVIEGRLPLYTPPAGTWVELARWSGNAQQYLALGYTSNLQLGLYLTNQSANLSLVSAMTLAPGAPFRLALAQAADRVTGLAVNGKTSLSYGTLLNFTLPPGVMTALQLATGPVPVIVSRLAGYAQALTATQLKYLTSV